MNIKFKGMIGMTGVPNANRYFTDGEAKQIISFFAEAGIIIEAGSTFSAKGQIAQLLNGTIMVMEHFERDQE